MQLDELIRPVPKQDFFARYWEAEPLLISRNRPDYFSSLFALRQLDHLLAHHPAEAKINLAGGNKKGRNRPPYSAEEAPDPDSAYECFYQGRTLVVNGLQRMWEPVSRLCRNLLTETGMRTQANLYVTPQKGTGFDCHWDGHDVIILQLEGAKRWRLYEAETHLPRPSSRGGACRKKGRPTRTVTLRPGDALYLPRGTPHQATAGDEPSVHLTLGLIAMTWEDLFMAAVRALGERNELMLKSLPCGWLSGSEALKPRLSAYRELTKGLFGERNMREALDLLAVNFFEDMPSLPDGHFAQLDLIDRIGIDTALDKRSGDLLKLTRTDEQALLFFPGGSCAGPTKLFWAFAFMADSKSFRVGDIPGWYSDEERLTIVRNLVRRGFLRVVALTSADGTSDSSKTDGSEWAVPRGRLGRREEQPKRK